MTFPEIAIWAAFALLQIADIVTTDLILRHGIELNILMRFLQRLGDGVWIVVKFAVAYAAAGLLWQTLGILGVALGCAMMVPVVAFNLRSLVKLQGLVK